MRSFFNSKLKEFYKKSEYAYKKSRLNDPEFQRNFQKITNQTKQNAQEFSNKFKQNAPFYQRIISKHLNTTAKNIQNNIENLDLKNKSKQFYTKYLNRIPNIKFKNNFKNTNKTKQNTQTTKSNNQHTFTQNTKSKWNSFIKSLKYHLIYVFIPWSIASFVVLRVVSSLMFGDNYFNKRSIKMDPNTTSLPTLTTEIINKQLKDNTKEFNK